jgi:16S rRNA G966 N2-methylase RsmD
VPHLRSLQGFSLIQKYVRNWYSLIPLYLNITSETIAKFKDGREIVLSKDNFSKFHEEVYRHYMQDNGFTYESHNDGSILVRTPSGLRLSTYSDKSYSFVLDEIFLMNVYGRPNLENRVVVDVGAGIGDTAIYFVGQGASRVYGFEPDSERYRLAQRTIALNKFENKITLFNAKATSESLKNIVFENNLKNVFVKIDCEGCENDIIENTDNNTFESITDIAMEYHEEPSSLVKKLSDLGFKVSIKKRNIVILATKVASHDYRRHSLNSYSL